MTTSYAYSLPECVYWPKMLIFSDTDRSMMQTNMVVLWLAWFHHDLMLTLLLLSAQCINVDVYPLCTHTRRDVGFVVASILG